MTLMSRGENMNQIEIDNILILLGFENGLSLNQTVWSDFNFKQKIVRKNQTKLIIKIST